jgi:hypothetical protein
MPTNKEAICVNVNVNVDVYEEVLELLKQRTTPNHPTNEMLPIINPPKGMNEGLQNYLVQAINQLNRGEIHAADATLRGLLDDVCCGIYVPKDK